jgi:hypothetical protein
MSNRLSVLTSVTSLLFACLLLSCDFPRRLRPESPVTSNTVPTVQQPEAAPPAPEYGLFTGQEAVDKVGYGCSLSLKRSEEYAVYLFYEANGKAVMKLNGDWAEFPSDFGATVNGQTTINPDNPRTMVSKDGQFTLTINVTRGDLIGEELIDIPTATLEVRAKNGSATAISGIGETGC